MVLNYSFKCNDTCLSERDCGNPNPSGQVQGGTDLNGLCRGGIDLRYQACGDTDQCSDGKSGDDQSCQGYDREKQTSVMKKTSTGHYIGIEHGSPMQDEHLSPREGVSIGVEPGGGTHLTASSGVNFTQLDSFDLELSQSYVKDAGSGAIEGLERSNGHVQVTFDAKPQLTERQ